MQPFGGARALAKGACILRATRSTIRVQVPSIVHASTNFDSRRSIFTHKHGVSRGHFQNVKTAHSHVRHFCKETEGAPAPEETAAAPVEEAEAAPAAEEAPTEGYDKSKKASEVEGETAEEVEARLEKEVFLENILQIGKDDEYHPLLKKENFTFIVRDHFEPASSYDDDSPQHPGNRKVKLHVQLGSIDLPAENLDTLAKLCGPRFCPQSKVLKLVCEDYPNKAQNQKALLELFGRIVDASKLTYEEDVPKVPKTEEELIAIEGARLGAGGGGER